MRLADGGNKSAAANGGFGNQDAPAIISISEHIRIPVNVTVIPISLFF